MAMVEPRTPTPIQRLAQRLVSLDGKTHEGVDAQRQAIRNEIETVGQESGVGPVAVSNYLDALRSDKSAQR